MSDDRLSRAFGSERVASVTATLAYDGQGQRVVRAMAGETRLYLEDWFEADVDDDPTLVYVRYYYLGGQRVALRTPDGVTYLHADHLGSTAETTGQETSEQLYYPYGSQRTTEEVAAEYRYTGQRWEEAIGLYDYRARYYDPALGRFIQPDSIVPEPGNPQSLNRYSYCLNSPIRYTDPSGYDPLDSVWEDKFMQAHGGRSPTWQDRLIRLFSIAFIEEWDPSQFYDAQGYYIDGSTERILRDNPASRSWTNMPDALERLAAWYNQGEERLFTRDIGTLFGGLCDRFEKPDAWEAISDEGNPVHVWAYLSRAGLSPALMGTSDADANVHHWAWCLTMGAEYFGSVGSTINIVREVSQFHWDWVNTWSDIAIGILGSELGFSFRLGLDNITYKWNFYMLDRWH